MLTFSGHIVGNIDFAISSECILWFVNTDCQNQTRSFVVGDDWLLFLYIAHFFPYNLPDLLSLLFRLIRKHHGGSEVTIMRKIFHHFSFLSHNMPQKSRKKLSILNWLKKAEKAKSLVDFTNSSSKSNAGQITECILRYRFQQKADYNMPHHSFTVNEKNAIAYKIKDHNISDCGAALSVKDIPSYPFLFSFNLTPLIWIHFFLS